MGYKGFIRSVQAEIRRAERDAKRRQRELERQQKEYEKMQELARAQYEVDCYENQIEVLKSVHKDCGENWDWQQLKDSQPPEEPVHKNINEKITEYKLVNYRPGFFTKLFGITEKKLEKLRSKVEEAKKIDEAIYQNALKQYNQDYKSWKQTQEIAEKICSGDISAYYEAVKEINPFAEISQLGSSVQFNFIDLNTIEIQLRPNSDKVIPAEIKTLLKSGKLSVKKMPTGQFNELFQDYICSCIIRVAREIFALIPVDMVIIHANAQLLNSSTGYMEDTTIVSAALPRATMANLNFDMLDPSDSMDNFIHNMNFKKQKGFEAVDRINPSSLKK